MSDGLRDELRRLQAHIDNQYRLIEDAVLGAEGVDVEVTVEDLLEDIAAEAGRAKGIADEIRETFYHSA